MKNLFSKENFPKKLSDLLPHLFTAINLCCGLLSILAAAQSEFLTASVLLVVGMLFDLIDGPTARILSGPSIFGKEFDSLSDQISFGVAPAFLYYKWVLINLHPVVGTLVFLAYVLCVSVRLSRFNANESIDEKPSAFFQGLSSPVAAGLICGIVGLYSVSYTFPPSTAYRWLPIPLILSLLMVSPIPFYSFKTTAIRKKLLIIAGLIVAWIYNPMLCLLAASGLYILSSLAMAAFLKIKSHTHEKQS